jgi:hypothetical protein
MTPYAVRAGRLGPVTIIATSPRQAERAFGTMFASRFDDRRASSVGRFMGTPARAVAMSNDDYRRARTAGFYEASDILRRSLAGTPRST